MALHATTIRFGDRAYTAIALAADAQGISVSQYVREAALIRAVLDELDSNEALHTAHDLLGIAREVRRLAEVEPQARPEPNPAAGPRRRAVDAGANSAGATTKTPRPADGDDVTAAPTFSGAAARRSTAAAMADAARSAATDEQGASRGAVSSRRFAGMRKRWSPPGYSAAGSVGSDRCGPARGRVASVGKDADRPDGRGLRGRRAGGTND